MLVKIIDNKSGTATGAVNYVLGSLNHKGEKRDFEPVVLRGDPKLTKEIDETFCAKFQHKAISGVIAFRQGEDLTPDEMNKFLDDFEKTFLGNMRNRVNAFYVLHEEKEEDGGTSKHVHFVINRCDLETGKSYNPFPTPQKSKQLLPNDKKFELKDLFQKIQNQLHGWKPVTDDDPLKIEQETKFLDKVHGLKDLKSKTDFDNYFQSLVKNGTVKNRDELLKHIKQQGFELSRLGQDYISIKMSDGKNVRLKGGIYEKNDGKDYAVKIEDTKKKNDEIIKSYKEPQSLTKQIERLNKLIEYRNTYNSKPERYSASTKNQPVFARELQREIEKQAQAKTASHTPAKVASHTPSTSATRTAGVDAVSARIGAIRAVSGHEPSPTLGMSSGGGGGGDIDGQINEARSAVMNAKTDIERANAKARLAQLLAQKEKMAQQKMKHG